MFIQKEGHPTCLWTIIKVIFINPLFWNIYEFKEKLIMRNIYKMK